MNLPADIQFHEEERLFVYRPQGKLDEAAVNRVVRVLGELEAATQAPFNRFLDTLETDAVELNFKYVIHISLYRRFAYANRPHVKSAILAVDATAIHYARLHAVLTQGSPIQVSIFQKREDVAKWLDVPVSLVSEVSVE
ncbi:MAG TPA: hypothetical protein VGI60_11670 [Chthoniobacterales bacterium]|jgi:hypothetical protein